MNQQGHNPHGEFQIFINTNSYKVAGPKISFEQVLALDNIPTAGIDLGLFDVAWKHGNNVGTLTPGQSVDLENGMKFDAGKSNRS
ncbi:multiubiquitin domain-containing protein [Vogesella indigofera]|uniref:multiubiquitin domain-containing protein n=1 Tax=Vogesella indigofera TaxID=45465 RepID=UPI00234EDB5B|nr:multiubiquitin domain-containing protein [Vogesella indigofera]MDC7709055.1 multiubiquitin domain-containing protein [Vogesella indigofera]